MFPHYSSLKTKQKNPLVKTILNCKRQHSLFSIFSSYCIPASFIHVGRWMKGGVELSIHYLKTWNGEPLPPKEIGFLFRKVLERGIDSGGHKSAVKGENHLGGFKLKVENEDCNGFLVKMLPSCFKSYLWSRERGACVPVCQPAAFSPSSPTSVGFFFFPTCFRISLHPSRPQIVEFGCASGRPALQYRL